MDVKTKSRAELEGLSNRDRVRAADEAEKARSQRFIRSLLMMVTGVVLGVLLVRTLVFAPFSIPSESMHPQLWNGDILLAAKWPYGYSSASLPLGSAEPGERFLPAAPKRGDIVIFKHPVDGSDYIKRVIGVPGDTVAMFDGRLILNGELVNRERVEDFIIPVSLNTGCNFGGRESEDENGATICAYPQYRETLPGGLSYSVLKFGHSDGDTLSPMRVPEGQLFVMGDSRDNSRDSRFKAQAGLGVGLVPQNNLVGRAQVIIWSTDGSATWLNPASWFAATRWDRIGTGL
ncbi:MAG: signal peptidase I [Pseudomonadota bacterium]